jgi:transposase-like protein
VSERENFLARWSRRKQEAESARVARKHEPAKAAEAEGAAKPAEAEEGAAKTAEPKEPEAAEEPKVDLSALPPIDSIGVGTDIRAFLQEGVPLHLARAALRRAWSADPAIRDFIEVAENQWDFAAGTDIPGFGPLDVDEHQVRRWVTQIIERPKVDDAEPPPLPEGEPQVASEPRPEGSNVEKEQQQNPAALAGADDTFVQRNNIESPEQQKSRVEARNALPLVRRHGRALPQ